MQSKAYPGDVMDEELALLVSYLTLMIEDAPQRYYHQREVFNSLHWLVRAGDYWRMMPHDLPPWPAVYQQTERWLKARVFESLAQDLRAVLRVAQGRNEEPSAGCT